MSHTQYMNLLTDLEHSDDIWRITEPSHVGGSSVHPVTTQGKQRTINNKLMTIQSQTVASRQSAEPLHKDAGLHCVDNAAEAWLVFRAAHHQGPLTGESGRQPVTDL